MKLYLDASAIIYSIEGQPSLRDAVLARFAAMEQDRSGSLVTSRLSALECRVSPLRAGRKDLLAIYDHFFTRSRLIVWDISAAIVERATQLRAKHNLRTPDALHVATAIEAHADAFLTGDKDLRRCTEIAVEVL